MEAKFSNRVKEVISLSREEAIRLGHDYIGTEHLLLGMIREAEGTALGLLRKLGVSIDELKFSLEQATRNTATQGTSITGSIPLTKQTEKVLKITYLEAKIFKSEIIGTEPPVVHPAGRRQYFFPNSQQIQRELRNCARLTGLPWHDRQRPAKPDA